MRIPVKMAVKKEETEKNGRNRKEWKKPKRMVEERRFSVTINMDKKTEESPRTQTVSGAPRLWVHGGTTGRKSQCREKERKRKSKKRENERGKEDDRNVYKD